jgi:type II secretory pathway pseudopilin PulG
MNQNSRRGFTIIELMLAMGFVSALLLAIAMTVIQISNIYNRGITYKDVNQAGSALASELQRSINSSSQFDVTLSSPKPNYINSKDDGGGRLCIGQYSYIWNYGSSSKTLNEYSPRDPINPIHFIKVIDPTKSYCDPDPRKPISKKDNPIELLNAGKHDLAIHDFWILSANSASDGITNQRLYSISFLIGTNSIDTLNITGEKCLTADNINSDINYCAINRFNIVARAR